MSQNGLVAVITDFGTRDSYVAEMKAVMLSVDSSIRIIDISHKIAPGDIEGAAYILRRSREYFPEHTVFLSVVDPGVGSERKIVALELENGQRFVGPDNGVLSWVCRNSEYSAFDISDYHDPSIAKQPSVTFEGRDRMSPVAARLATGEDISRFGIKIDGIQTLALPRSRQDDSKLIGAIIWLDHYGNAITNITEDDIGDAKTGSKIAVNNRVVANELSRTFSSVAHGEIVAYIGSCGFVEIAVNGGNFATEYGIERGAEVEIER